MRCSIPFAAALLLAVAAQAAPLGAPDAVVDLSTQGVTLVRGTWRYADAAPVRVAHRAPDAEGQPTGAAVSGPGGI